MVLLWQFEGGKPYEVLLDALESAQGHCLLLPCKMDCEEVLRLFARQCALEVVSLWDAPDVVRRYLETGEESLRNAARCAAWSVASRPAAARCATVRSAAAASAAAGAVAVTAARSASAWSVVAMRFAVRPGVARSTAASMKRAQSQRLATLLATHICPVPEELHKRVEQYHQLCDEQPELAPLYVGLWWAKGLEGLDGVEV